VMPPNGPHKLGGDPNWAPTLPVAGALNLR
jgi:hypothetical protein